MLKRGGERVGKSRSRLPVRDRLDQDGRVAGEGHLSRLFRHIIHGQQVVSIHAKGGNAIAWSTRRYRIVQRMVRGGMEGR